MSNKRKELYSRNVMRNLLRVPGDEGRLSGRLQFPLMTRATVGILTLPSEWLRALCRDPEFAHRLTFAMSGVIVAS